jgi:hypothetical protein
MARTSTPAPTDKKMWRRLLRVVHPDTGGDHDLFIWAGALFDHVAGDALEEAPRHVRREPPKHHPRTTSGDRVPFEEAFDKAPSFTHLTEQALGLAENAALDQKAKSAREKLLASADEYELSSIPFPGGQSLRTNSVELLSLTQGERSRIVERLSYENPNIARMKAAGKNVPASAENKPANVLREEYARGLDIGGPQGGAICRAVVGLAEDRGMSVDDIVDAHRRGWQRAYLENAQQQRIQARSVYSRVPLPSSPRPGGAQSPQESRAGKRRTPFGMPKKASAAIQKKRRKPHWK